MLGSKGDVFDAFHENISPCSLSSLSQGSDEQGCIRTWISIPWRDLHGQSRGGGKNLNKNETLTRICGKHSFRSREQCVLRCSWTPSRLRGCWPVWAKGGQAGKMAPKHLQTELGCSQSASVSWKYNFQRKKLFHQKTYLTNFGNMVHGLVWQDCCLVRFTDH